MEKGTKTQKLPPETDTVQVSMNLSPLLIFHAKKSHSVLISII